MSKSRSDHYTMKLMIVSDGTVIGTKLVHAETREVLADVTAVSWTVNADHPFNVANVQLVGIATEVVGNLKRIVRSRKHKKAMSEVQVQENVIFLDELTRGERQS